MTEWTREFPTEPSVVLCCWHSQPVATTHNEAPPMIAGTNVWKCRRYINQNSKHSTCVSLLHTTAVWPKWMCSMISSFAAQCQPVHFNWASAHFIDTPHIYICLLPHNGMLASWALVAHIWGPLYIYACVPLRHNCGVWNDCVAATDHAIISTSTSSANVHMSSYGSDFKRGAVKWCSCVCVWHMF